MEITALKVAGFVFLVMSIAQFLRLIFKVKVTANDKVVPLWLSMIAAPLLLFLSFYMFLAAR